MKEKGKGKTKATRSTSSTGKPPTTSRKSAGKKKRPAAKKPQPKPKAAERDSTAHKPLQPNTIDHWLRYSRHLILDNGRGWEPEDFQIAFVEDLFAGYPEVWLVVPEGNGKTSLLAGVALYHIDYTPDAMAPIGASSRDQIEILHGQAAGFVRRTPGLDRRFKVFDGYRRVKSLRMGGKIQVYASDERTGDGVIPTLPLLDELHRHRDLRLYRTWRGKLDKRGGQLAAISTAGEPDGEFEEIRLRHRDREAETIERRGSHVRAVGGGMVLHDYAVPDEDEVEDMEAVKAANPLSTITVESLEQKRGSPTMTRDHWKRMVCNIATRLQGDGVAPEEWDALADPKAVPNKSAWSLGWLDLGWKVDTTAMGVLIWEGTERRVIAGVKILKPPVEEGEIVSGLVSLQQEFEPEAWVFDPNAGAPQMAQLLEAGEHPRQGNTRFEFIEHSQGNAPMSLAAARLDEAIRNGWLVHDGNSELRAHILNAVRRQIGSERYRFDRPPAAKGEKRKHFPIDALTGLLMGNSVAVAEKVENKPKEPLVAWR